MTPSYKQSAAKIRRVADQLAESGFRSKAKGLRATATAIEKMPVEPTLEWFKPFRVDIGKDGKYGIYARDFNCRLATFNANTHALQSRLRLLFDRANAPLKIIKPRRAARGKTERTRK